MPHERSRRQPLNHARTAVVCARVSSREQREEGYSLDAQLRLLREHARSKALRVVREFSFAESAKDSEERAEFKAHGITTRKAGSVTHQVRTGQDVLRAAIATADNVRRFLVVPAATVTIASFQNYRARELSDGSFDALPDPDAANHKFSHPADGCRYFTWTQRRALGVASISGGTSEEENKE